VVTVVTLAANAVRPGPALALSAATARAGDSVEVTGSHLPAGQPGTIVLLGREAPLGSFRSDASGRFTFRFVVPQDVAGGRRVQACWGGSCPIGQPLTVFAAPTPLPTATPPPVPVQTLPPPTPTPSRRFAPAISLSDQTVRHGQNVSVSGRGFDPGAQYVIAFVESGRSVPLQEAASPDDEGSFKRSVRIPSDAHRGVALVTACISSAGQVGACAQQAVLVTG
jgi:hypothetical protein